MSNFIITTNGFIKEIKVKNAYVYIREGDILVVKDQSTEETIAMFSKGDWSRCVKEEFNE